MPTGERLRVALPLRWGDLDAYGHVNNATMLRLLEEARVRTFWVNGEDDPAGAAAPAAPGLRLVRGGAAADTLTLIAEQRVRYLAPMPYTERPVDIQMWVTQIGGASFELGYEVFSPVGVEPPTLYCRASSTIVFVDAATGRPRAMSPEERAGLEAYRGEPVDFSRRG